MGSGQRSPGAATCFWARGGGRLTEGGLGSLVARRSSLVSGLWSLVSGLAVSVVVLASRGSWRLYRGLGVSLSWSCSLVSWSWRLVSWSWGLVSWSWSSD